MNYEETKLTEALAICAGDDCDGCPYYDFHQCYEQVKRGAHKLIIKQDRTIERLKDENTRLTEKLKQVLLTVDTVKEMNIMCKIDEQNAEIERLKAENCELTKKLEARLTCDFVKTAQTHAVQDFAEKVKGEVYPFLQAEMYNKKHFITGDLISDKLLENQNIGILKAQDVLSKWFKVKIDELLKEYKE